MVNIPSDLVFGQNVGSPQLKLSTSASPEIAASTAADMGKLADTVFKIGLEFDKRAAELEEARQFTEITTALSKARADIDQSMNDHIDHNTYMATWESKWKKAKDSTLSAARGNMNVYKAVQANTAQQEMQEYAQQKVRQRQLTTDNMKGTFITAYKTGLASIRTQQDAEQFIVNTNILNDAGLRLWGAEQHAKHATEIPAHAAEAYAEVLMAQSPSTLVSELGKRDSFLSRTLSVEKYGSFSKGAVDAMWTNEERTRKRADDDLADKEWKVSDGIRAGEIGAADIRRMAQEGGWFRPERYEYFRDEVKNYEKGDYDDKSIVDALEVDLYDPNTTRSVTPERIRALERSGQLSSGSAKRIMKDVRSVREAESRLPDGFSQGLTVLKEHYAPSLVTLNPRAEEVTFFTPIAREYRDWVMSNPGATAYDLQKKAYEIVDRKKKADALTKRPGKRNPYAPLDTSPKAKEDALKKMRQEFALDKGKWEAHTQKEWSDWYYEIKRGGN